MIYTNPYLFFVIECVGNIKANYWWDGTALLATLRQDKFLKTWLCNKMKNDFLANCMIIYIESKIVDSIDMNFIINEFDKKSHRLKHSVIRIVWLYLHTTAFFFLDFGIDA